MSSWRTCLFTWSATGVSWVHSTPVYLHCRHWVYYEFMAHLFIYIVNDECIMSSWRTCLFTLSATDVSWVHGAPVYLHGRRRVHHEFMAHLFIYMVGDWWCIMSLWSTCLFTLSATGVSRVHGAPVYLHCQRRVYHEFMAHLFIYMIGDGCIMSSWRTCLFHCRRRVYHEFIVHLFIYMFGDGCIMSS
jgi:flavin reductase (DIM6/NTAB) family NADH-FMN oxidoreductase RutF